MSYFYDIVIVYTFNELQLVELSWKWMKKIIDSFNLDDKLNIIFDRYQLSLLIRFDILIQ